MYRQMCDACVLAGLRAPTPAEWIERLEEMIGRPASRTRPLDRGWHRVCGTTIASAAPAPQPRRVEMLRNVCLLCTALVMAPSMVHGQTMFRCSENGKTTYSDRPCLSGDEVKRLAPSGGPTPEDAARARMRAQADRERAAAGGSAPPPSASTSGRVAPAPTMSAYDIEKRTRELKAILASTTIDKEKRRAAEDELERLQRGVGPQLSPDDQKRMRELRVGLASMDQRTRAAAEAEQRAILDRNDSPAVVAERKRSEAAAAEARAAQRAEEERLAADARARARANEKSRHATAAPPAATHITACAGGTCTDDAGNVYSGQGPITNRSDGKTCHQAGTQLICN